MRSWTKWASIVFVFAIAACNLNVKPVYNVDRASFNSPEPLTEAQATEAILNAGSKLGWNMVEVESGLIRGDINVRGKHDASVAVSFDGQGYSINYNDSQNLKYDPETGSIHKNYNSWVQNLERQIRIESGSV